MHPAPGSLERPGDVGTVTAAPARQRRYARPSRVARDDRPRNLPTPCWPFISLFVGRAGSRARLAGDRDDHQRGPGLGRGLAVDPWFAHMARSTCRPIAAGSWATPSASTGSSERSPGSAGSARSSRALIFALYVATGALFFPLIALFHHHLGPRFEALALASADRGGADRAGDGASVPVALRAHADRVHAVRSARRNRWHDAGDVRDVLGRRGRRSGGRSTANGGGRL